MHHADYNNILLRREDPYLLHEIDLVVDIEERERLVQEQIAPCVLKRTPYLRQHASELDSLPFAATERAR
jgi:hypothetical protein